LPDGAVVWPGVTGPHEGGLVQVVQQEMRKKKGLKIVSVCDLLVQFLQHVGDGT
jgi:hypothetical protein